MESVLIKPPYKELDEHQGAFFNQLFSVSSSEESKRFTKEIDFLFYFEMGGQAYLVVYEMKSSSGGFSYPNDALIDQIGKWQ